MKNLVDLVEGIFDDQDDAIKIRTVIDEINSTPNLTYRIDGIEDGWLVVSKRVRGKVWIGSELASLEGLIKGIRADDAQVLITAFTPHFPIQAYSFNIEYSHPDLRLNTKGIGTAIIERDALKTGTISISNAQGVQIKYRDFEYLIYLKNLKLPNSKNVFFNIIDGYISKDDLYKKFGYLMGYNEKDSKQHLPDKFDWLKGLDKNIMTIGLNADVTNDRNRLHLEFGRRPNVLHSKMFVKELFNVSWKTPVHGWYLRAGMGN